MHTAPSSDLNGIYIASDVNRREHLGDSNASRQRRATGGARAEGVRAARGKAGYDHGRARRRTRPHTQIGPNPITGSRAAVSRIAERTARRAGADFDQMPVSTRLEAGVIKHVLHEIRGTVEVLQTQIQPYPIHSTHQCRRRRRYLRHRIARSGRWSWRSQA